MVQFVLVLSIFGTKKFSAFQLQFFVNVAEPCPLFGLFIIYYFVGMLSEAAFVVLLKNQRSAYN